MKALLFATALIALISCGAPPRRDQPAEPGPGTAEKRGPRHSEPAPPPSPPLVKKSPKPEAAVTPFEMRVSSEPETFADWLRIQRKRVEKAPGDVAELRRLAAMTAAEQDWDVLEALLQRDGLEKDAFLASLRLFWLERVGKRKEALKALEKMADGLRKGLPVRIGRAVLCRKILGFRRYLPMIEPRFRPGGMILLYLEIEHFSLKPWKDYQTMHIRYDWKLSDDRGRVLRLPTWENAAPEEREDKTEFRGIVREFHQSFGLPLPRNLPGGRYVLTVIVEDVPSGTKDRVRIPLEVVFE